MIELRVKEINLENKKEADGRWIAFFSLNLEGRENAQSELAAIAEWFYAVVCNQEYLNNPIDQKDLKWKSIAEVQEELNTDQILEKTRRRLSEMEADTWPQAFEYLERFYIHED